MWSEDELGYCALPFATLLANPPAIDCLPAALQGLHRDLLHCCTIQGLPGLIMWRMQRCLVRGNDGGLSLVMSQDERPHNLPFELLAPDQAPSPPAGALHAMLAR